MTITDTDLRINALERATNAFATRDEALETAQEFYKFLTGEHMVELTASSDDFARCDLDEDPCSACDWEQTAGRALNDAEMEAFWNTSVLPPLPFSQDQLNFDDSDDVDPEDDPNVLAKVYFTKESLEHLLTVVSGFIVLSRSLDVPTTDPTFQYAVETMGNILETLGVDPQEAVESEDPNAFIDSIINNKGV